MEGKLVKRSNSRFDLYTIEDINQINTIASSFDNPKGKLSTKNCESIENGYDLDELVKSKYPNVDNEDFEYDCEHDMIRDNYRSRGFYEGAKAIIEILGDKKFSEDDVINAHYIGWIDRGESDKIQYPQAKNNYIQSLQQTEWDVEVELDEITTDDISSIIGKPKLDSNGCLILKRI